MNRAFSFSIRRKLVSFWIATILMHLLVGTLTAMAAESGWQEAGMRMGIQAGSKSEYFHLYEAYAVYGLPWEWRKDSGWGLNTQFETSAGALDGGDEVGFIATIGPGLTFNKSGKGPTLESGVNLSLDDRRQFGRQDFGSILLWGAYMGFSYRFTNGLVVGYRMQHLSNNRILYSNSTPNPGVDMDMISVGWRF